MAQQYPVAGCKFYIGTQLDPKSADFVAADFASIVWTEVKNWLTMGGMGDTAQAVNNQIIGEGREKVAKGTRNAGAMANTFANDTTDPGQQALAAAQATSYNYAFKIELNDKPAAGASPKNSLRYFVGLVMSAPEGAGGANSTRTLEPSIQINSNIVQVAASAT